VPAFAPFRGPCWFGSTMKDRTPKYETRERGGKLGGRINVAPATREGRARVYSALFVNEFVRNMVHDRGLT
jgi:hypothetical protein